MAQTKVKLVSNGVITVDNLHTNHGITTDHIGEGSVLYYTDARVQNYLTTNNYITTTDVTNLETVTSLGLNANILSYTNEAGVTTNIDLSLYLDDTNLARLVSGTLDGVTGIATFTRDDATTFTVDLSSLTPSETDPIFSASVASGITSTNISNWNTAYGWGNHASAGYQSASTAITTSNIGSQSVTNASTANGANGNFYVDDNYGNTIVGLYDSTRYQGVWAMGDAYKLPADGTTTGNLYGLAWSHPNTGGVAGNLNDHGLLVINNGLFASAISSSIRAAADMRSPIFYDYNNTGYYLDPASASELNTITTGTRARWGEPRWWTDRQQFTSDQGYWTGTNGWGTSHGTWDGAWKGGFSGWDIWGENSAHPQGASYRHAQGIVSGQHYSDSSGSSAYGWMMVGAHNATENRYWLRGKWASSTSGWVEMYTTGNMDAPNKSGTSYYQTNTWMQFNGNYGLYWPSQYGGHFRPNDGSTYTQFRIDGSKNSYGGIWDSYSAVNGIMYDSAGNGGVYREANARWYFYHHVGNNCTGINTSATSASYGLYVSKGIYSTDDIVAYSDARKKTNINTIDSALDKVNKLRGVYYDRIDDLERGRQVGVIAQEVNEVLPEAVTYAEDIDEYGVKYGNIVGVLIEAIKEQQQQIEELKQLIKKQ